MHGFVDVPDVWARARPHLHFRAYTCMHGRVDDSGVRAHARPCVWTFSVRRTRARPRGTFGWNRGSAIRDAWLGACVVRRFVMHGLVVMNIRIAHGLNFIDDWVMWLN